MLNYLEYIDNRGVLNIIRRACNYVDPRLLNHGARVAYLVSKILIHLGNYSELEIRNICFIAMFHDIGAYKTEEINRLLEFETKDVWDHSIYGYLFIRHFSPLKEYADVVLHHHTTFRRLETIQNVSRENKRLAQILNLADRADVFMEEENHGWTDFFRLLAEEKQGRFDPELKKLFAEVAAEHEIERPFEKSALEDEEYGRILWSRPFTKQEIEDYLTMLIFTIDFRSCHTVTHTITTVSISFETARRLGMRGDELSSIACGALLHDLGKIGIPVEILEFPGKLSPQAMTIMKTHVGITEKILGDDVHEKVKRIALRHHEKLDGSGYPDGLKACQLSPAERVVAAGDIVSALVGTRSYKEAFPKEKAVGILSQMSEHGLLDAEIVDLIIREFDEIMDRTREHCRPVTDQYLNLQNEYQAYCRIFEEFDREENDTYRTPLSPV